MTAPRPHHKSEVQRNRDTYRGVNTYQTWERPCSDCRSDEPRPKWQYRCDRCKVQYRQICDAD